MDLHQFLQQFIALDMAHVAVVAVFVGGVVFGVVQGADALVKRRNPEGLSSDVKFYGALVLSFILPIGAYLLDSTENAQVVDVNGVFLAGCVGFAAATAIHWVADGSPKARGVTDPPQVPPAA